VAVFGCARCEIILTLRPAGHRDHVFCFPHADDFRGCDTCGTLCCETCGAEAGERCPECGGRSHPGRRFEPTGEYRLPPGLRRLGTAEERVAAVGRLWDRGVLAAGWREHLLRIIAEQAGAAPEETADPTA
jgi:hypothetical protein